MSFAKNLFKPLLIAVFTLTASMSSSARAQPTPAADITARYDADMQQCKTMKGNERDACTKAAKDRRDSARADSKAVKETSEARPDALKTERDSLDDVAKEKCDAMSGEAQAQCIAQAKAKYGK